MKDFKKSGPRRERGGGFDRRPGFSRPGGGGRSFERPQMFPAVCDKCGKSCEVPFRPNGSRPVYCSDCFGGNRGGAPVNRPERREFPAAPQPQSFVPKAEDRRIDDIKRQLDSISSKLDKLVAAAEAANRAIPVPEFVVPSSRLVPKTNKAVLMKAKRKSKDSLKKKK